MIKRKRHRMYFDSPVFDTENNPMMVSVRKGKKWFSLLDRCDTFDIVAKDDRLVGEGKVRGLIISTFLNLPFCIIKLNHDPQGQSKKGLKDVLVDKYGKDIIKKSLLTVVFFSIIP